MRESDREQIERWQESDDGGTFLDIADLEAAIARLEDRLAYRAGIQALRQYWPDLMAAQKRLEIVAKQAQPHLTKAAS